MAQLKQRKPSEDDRVSKSRVTYAVLLTIFSVILVVLWGFHAVWAAKVILNRTYGSFFNNLVFGPGTFVAGVGLSVKLVTYLNNVLLEERLDMDHKKYI
ncbi:hypothetical protein CLIB1423_25S01486 [[Candida] railenensis]|uniref:Uncharacterized protein n=1 Tax=[Candida] railenensis TaxID=45579 RepID=A0A9P0QUT2_9ASCO|nr:hypothetical protein CLIB1423_25S01486 [[Candida] railenensis]